MEAIESIKARRSVRKFLDKDVPDDIIEKLIDAARHAPSSVDSQPWGFVVVKKKETKEKFAATRSENNQVERSAPVLIVVCCDMEKSKSRWAEDCALAAENLMLAASSLGLGSVYLTAYKHPIEAGQSETERTIVKELGLPENVRPACVIALGYPDETPEPKKVRDISELLHKEKW